jgi:hypothetical protein
MPRSRLHPLAAFAVAIGVVLAAPAVARADVISDWNVSAQRETLMLRPTAHGQSRGIAMVQGAVYDAVKCNRRRVPAVPDRLR